MATEGATEDVEMLKAAATEDAETENSEAATAVAEMPRVASEEETMKADTIVVRSPKAATEAEVMLKVASEAEVAPKADTEAEITMLRAAIVAVVISRLVDIVAEIKKAAQ